MRILTAGESHGYGMVTILEGFPQGVPISEQYINQELSRRMQGYGRGKRMDIERDTVEILSGVRNRKSMGSPLSLLVKNRDHRIFSQKNDGLSPLYMPRPGHADLAGAVKYTTPDVRNILERASARETVSRVCAGAVCKQFLSQFNVAFGSFVTAVGTVFSEKKPKNIQEILAKTSKSELACLDAQAEKRMKKEIDLTRAQGDTIGGVVEIWVEGVTVGIGSAMHFDQRLDAKIAGYLMSIPSVKGVEIGAGFEYAKQRGSKSHDALQVSKDKRGMKKTRIHRSSNNAGGIEGGISNGEPLIARIGVKPIPTVKNALDSFDIVTHEKKKAIVERSDVCVVAAVGVIAESMIAISLTEAFLAKFGSDSLKEIKRNYTQFIKHSIV